MINRSKHQPELKICVDLTDLNKLRKNKNSVANHLGCLGSIIVKIFRTEILPTFQSSF